MLRPLAGFWFLNMRVNPKTYHVMSTFPSPCGVLVLKLVKFMSGDKLQYLFPSPCGVLVLKLLTA